MLPVFLETLNNCGPLWEQRRIKRTKKNPQMHTNCDVRKHQQPTAVYGGLCSGGLILDVMPLSWRRVGTKVMRLNTIRFLIGFYELIRII